MIIICVHSERFLHTMLFVLVFLVFFFTWYFVSLSLFLSPLSLSPSVFGAPNINREQTGHALGGDAAISRGGGGGREKMTKKKKNPLPPPWRARENKRRRPKGKTAVSKSHCNSIGLRRRCERTPRTIIL